MNAMDGKQRGLLADGFARVIELPNWDHDTMARVDCVRQWQSGLGFRMGHCDVAHDFSPSVCGLSLAKEAQAAALLPVFRSPATNYASG